MEYKGCLRNPVETFGCNNEDENKLLKNLKTTLEWNERNLMFNE